MLNDSGRISFKRRGTVKGYIGAPKGSFKGGTFTGYRGAP